MIFNSNNININIYNFIMNIIIIIINFNNNSNNNNIHNNITNINNINNNSNNKDNNISSFLYKNLMMHFHFPLHVIMCLLIACHHVLAIMICYNFLYE